MKANELRIGNLYDNNGEVCIVTPTIICEVWEAERSWVKPIPLTEEWLLKFGASRTNSNPQLFILNSNEVIEVLFTGDEVIVYYDGLKKIYKEGVHVHTFQNLIHALTGEELIIN
jgi:hypothetical protein